MVVIALTAALAKTPACELERKKRKADDDWYRRTQSQRILLRFCRRRRCRLLLLLGLTEQRVAGCRGFLTIVLVNAHALVGIVRMGATGPEGNWIYGKRVSGLRLLQDELEAALLSAGQIPIDQFRTARTRRAAGRRAELHERRRIYPILRVVLGFGRVNGCDGLRGCHFLGVAAGAGQLGQGHRQNDQDDRDDNQELDQGEARRAADTIFRYEKHGSI
jgi:hypothetical protein